MRVSRVHFGDAIRGGVSCQSSDIGVDKVMHIFHKLSNSHETDWSCWLGRRPMDQGLLMIKLDTGQTFLDSQVAIAIGYERETII